MGARQSFEHSINEMPTKCPQIVEISRGCFACEFQIWLSCQFQFFVTNTAGTGNTIGLAAGEGATLIKSGNTITGTQAESATGGTITSGVTNPWGDNTTQQRAAGIMYLDKDFVIPSANVLTKLPLNLSPHNVKNTANIATNSFIVPESGIYLLHARAGFSGTGAASNAVIGLVAYTDGGVNGTLDESPILSTQSGCSLSGSLTLLLNADQKVEIYVTANYASTITSNVAHTFATLTNIA
ncbi:hypothetical protein D3C76_905220 [compost metagenome]